MLFISYNVYFELTTNVAISPFIKKKKKDRIEGLYY